MLILPLYFWFVTTGTGVFAPDNPKIISYNLLGDAFARGQIHLRVAPSPELLALPNPYNAQQQAKYALQDASLFGRRYYLYFGPFPGVVHAVFELATGRNLPTTTATFLLGLSAALAFHCVAGSLRKRAFPDLPPTGMYGVGLLFALGGTGLYLQSRPSIYHEAALAGSGFLLWGFYFWLLAFGESQRKAAWAVLSGVCFACAVGSRFNLVFYALAFAFAAFLQSRREREPESARNFTRLAAPVAVALGLLLAYNAARFGSPLEFGGKYQMVCSQGAIQRLDRRLIPQNFRAYFGTVPQFLPFYPFQQSQDIYIKNPEWFLEAGFCSALLIAPLFLLAPLPLFAALFRRFASGKPAQSVEKPEIQTFIGAAAFGSGANVLLLLYLAWAAVRYMQDFLPAGLLLGAIGLWRIERETKRSHFAAQIYRASSTLLTGAGIVFSAGLALSEINLHAPNRTLRIAYVCDRIEGAILSRLAPGAWPELYVSQAGAKRAFADDIYLDSAARPPAVFIVEGESVALPVYGGLSVDYLEADSLFDHSVRVQVEVNGRSAGETILPPGWQSGELSRPFALPAGVNTAQVRLRFPDEPPQAKGTLRPFRLRGI